MVNVFQSIYGHIIAAIIVENATLHVMDRFLYLQIIIQTLNYFKMEFYTQQNINKENLIK